MKTWQELTITVHRDAEEAVSNMLIEAGSQGVAISDSADYLGQPDRFGEIFPDVTQDDMITITGYFPESFAITEVTASLEKQVATLKSTGLETGPVSIASHELEEEDWAENWKKYYEPARITHDLTIVPSWTDYDAKPEEKVIKLDPGMAFGTGTHPTTKMSLFALEQVLRGGETVIDVGTGSGVLSIASSLLGAKEIYAYDLDEVAVRSAQENVDLNANTENIHVSANDLLVGVEQEADVIVANILADIIVLMVEDAWRLLKPEGTLIVSGIIEDKKDMVLEEMYTQGFEVDRIFQQKDWFAIILKKPEED